MSTSSSSPSSSSSSPGTSPVTTHSTLDSEPGTPSGLGLNVKLDTYSRIRSDDGPSPAPSLITLHSSLPASPDPTTPSTEEGEIDFLSPEVQDDAPTMRRRKMPAAGTMTMTQLANGTATTKKPAAKVKGKPQRHKSPLLDALKLPPLSEISIPKPVQIK